MSPKKVSSPYSNARRGGKLLQIRRPAFSGVGRFERLPCGEVRRAAGLPRFFENFAGDRLIQLDAWLGHEVHAAQIPKARDYVVHELHVVGKRGRAGEGQHGHGVTGMAQLGDLLGFGMRFAFSLHGQKRAVLLSVTDAPIAAQAHLFIDDDLDAQRFALAQAFFEILLGPKSGRGPGMGQQERDLVAPIQTLRVKKAGQLPSGLDLLIGERGARDPLGEIDASERQRIQAAACEWRAMPAGGGIAAIELQRNLGESTRSRERSSVESGSVI